LALKGLPSWQTTSRRSFTSKVVGVVQDQLSASPGTSFAPPSAVGWAKSRRMSVSKIE
jgi:hypothetical protein